MKFGSRAEKSAESEDILPKRLVIQFFKALLKFYIFPEIIFDHISAA